MTSFLSNSIQIIRGPFTVRNSLLNILPYNSKKFKNKSFKIQNVIRGSYKDKILKDSIYISSNNLKKDFFLRKQELNLFYNNSNYLSYLENSSNNIYNQFNQFCKIYNKGFYKHFYYKQYYFKYFSNFLIKYKKNIIRTNSKTWNHYKNLKRTLVLGIDNNYNTLIPITNTFTSNFLNQKGVFLKFRPRMFSYSVFTGLINIVPNSGQIYFRRALSLPYLCLQFKKKLFKINNALNLYYSLYLYIIFYKYNVQKFYKNLNKNKINARRSNPFLVYYQKKLELKLRLLTTFITQEKFRSLINTNYLSLNEKVKTFQKLVFNLYFNLNFKPINKLDNYFYYKTLLNYQILNILKKNIIFNFTIFFSITKLKNLFFFRNEFRKEIYSFTANIVKIQRIKLKKKSIRIFAKHIDPKKFNFFEKWVALHMRPKWWFKKMEKKARPKNRRRIKLKKYA